MNRRAFLLGCAAAVVTPTPTIDPAGFADPILRHGLRDGDHLTVRQHGKVIARMSNVRVVSRGVPLGTWDEADT